MKSILFILVINLVISHMKCFNLNFKGLRKFVEKEKSILDLFEKYLISEEKRLSHLRQMFQYFSHQNSIALKDINLFLSHPNDVYFLMRRIAIEWKDLEELLKPNKTIRNELKLKMFQANFTEFNFTEAIKGYENIIYFYESDISSAANGVITYKTPFGEQKLFKSLTNQTLTSFDCFSIGKQSFDNKDYIASKKWLSIALNRTNKSDPQLKADIFEYLSITEYHLGNYTRSFNFLRKSLKLSPNRQTNKILLDHLIALANVETSVEFPVSDEYIENTTNDSNITMNSTENDFMFFNKVSENRDYLCLGKQLMNESMNSELKCFYLNTKSKPYLLLTRIRVEELNKRPQILLFHNFLSETEVQIMKYRSISRMNRMKVIDSVDKSYVMDQGRLAEGVFISEKDDTFIENINRRISLITGLNASDSTSEPLNVIRYNVGGVYETHHDTGLGADTRIATWINYLSDVDAGGATVFPELNVSSFPKKYSSIFWYNILSSGKRCEQVIHCGCPLLYGQKYIAVKWLHLLGQDWTHKCSLNKNDYKILK